MAIGSETSGEYIFSKTILNDDRHTYSTDEASVTFIIRKNTSPITIYGVRNDVGLLPEALGQSLPGNFVQIEAYSGDSTTRNQIIAAMKNSEISFKFIDPKTTKCFGSGNLASGTLALVANLALRTGHGAIGFGSKPKGPTN